MKLRTFTAADMPTAMEQVRAALGEDAVILSSTTDRASRQVTLTAAVEDEDDIPLPPPPPAPRNLKSGGGEMLATNAGSDAWLDELTFLLRYHGVPEALAGRMAYKARELEIEPLFALERLSAGNGRALLSAKALAKLLIAFFHFTPLALAPGSRILLAGPPGVGKTLAIAKLAAQACMDKLSVTVVTTDNKRAGGVEQLSAFTDILKIPLHAAESPKDLTAALRNVPPQGLALIDTAGCNPYDREEIEGLAELIASAHAEPVLTLPAGMDPYEAADTARAFTHPAIKRMLISRADAARRLGGVLAAADGRKLAFAGTSMSARVVGEIAPLDAAQLARMLLDSSLKTG